MGFAERNVAFCWFSVVNVSFSIQYVTHMFAHKLQHPCQLPTCSFGTREYSSVCFTFCEKYGRLKRTMVVDNAMWVRTFSKCIFLVFTSSIFALRKQRRSESRANEKHSILDASLLELYALVASCKVHPSQLCQLALELMGPVVDSPATRRFQTTLSAILA